MCIICVEFQSKKLSPAEVLKNISEMKDTIGEEHAKEIVKMLFSDATIDEQVEILQDALAGGATHVREGRKSKSDSESDEDWNLRSD